MNDLPPPYLSTEELRELRRALGRASLYIAPVGLHPAITADWKLAHGWAERLDRLIAESEEYDAELGAGSS